MHRGCRNCRATDPLRAVAGQRGLDRGRHLRAKVPSAVDRCGVRHVERDARTGARAAVDVTFMPPAGPAGGLYGGYLVLTPDHGSAVLRMPFAATSATIGHGRC